MGEVYLAHDTQLRRPVAVKALTADLTQDEERLHRFEQEAFAASSLNHPNILTVYEIGQIGNTHFIATEFIDGITLRQHMALDRIKINEVLDIAVQVVSAVAAAHQAGIVHRDIKPDNIMLRRDGFVKVLDFGLAKLTQLSGEDQTGDSGAQTIAMISTEPGMIMGTFAYMSPEQARGLEVDERTDIWGVGVVLYEMIANKVPFAGDTNSDVLARILERDPPALAQYAQDLPIDLERIVAKALAKDKHERYQTAQDFLADLKKLRHRVDALGTAAELGQVFPTGVNTAGESRENHDQRVDKITATQQTLIGRATDAWAPAPPTARVEGSPAGGRRAKSALAAVTALALAIAAALIFYTKSSSNDAVAMSSIAVLPFANTSADANTEYISDGITEQLINDLSQFPQLQVIARSTAFRYKSKEVDPKVVGRELGVRAVLMGRILQLDDVLNIQTELVDVEKGTQIWGAQYNYKISGIFLLQEKISREISKSLKLKLTGEDEKRLGKRYTEDTEAYQMYLKGRYFWNKRTGPDIRKGIDYFEQAIAKDPNYALAYAGLAYSYLVLPGYTDVSSHSVDQKVKEAATTALSLDDSLAEAHAALANAAWRFEWDMSGAERGYRRAIDLNPNYATAHQWYALFLSDLRRHDEAIEEMQRALKNDPLSLSINNGMGRIFAEAGEYDLAIAQLRKTLELDQSFRRAHRYLGEVYVQKGMFDQAIAEFQQSIEASDNYMGLAGLAHAYAVAHRNSEAQKVIEDLQSKQNQNESLSYQLAMIYAGQGENKRALEELQKAYENRSPWLIHLNVEPRFNKLRSAPEFIDLLKHVGFVK